jgi:hypothetical protein
LHDIAPQCFGCISEQLGLSRLSATSAMHISIERAQRVLNTSKAHAVPAMHRVTLTCVVDTLHESFA